MIPKETFFRMLFFPFRKRNVSLRCFLFLLFCYPSLLFAQAIQLDGVVKDENGERLPLANVLVLPDSVLTPAGIEGNFSLQIKPGAKIILITYTGYEVVEKEVLLQKDTTMTFTLAPLIGQLEEVIVSTYRYSQKNILESTRTGTHTLTGKDISEIPVLGGEADLIKTLQLLPGTVRGVEGSSDLFVRGGAADQNQVLLDGASIYNTGHLLGFFSVFNSDILEKAEAINGGFPAEFGGRLSSVLDITTHNRLAKETNVSGSIGLISSRLFVEQPLIKNKASIWLAGRRTYIDQVVKKMGEEELPYYFYDLNGKLILQPGKNNQLTFSYYGGEDVLDLFRDSDNDGSGFRSAYISANNSQSLQWRHQRVDGWRSELSLVRTSYLYDIRNVFEENELLAFSDIEDFGAKIILEKDSIWEKASIKAGMEWIRHDVSPNVINTAGFFSDLIGSSETGGKIAHEAAAFVQQEWMISPRIILNAGFRGSLAVVSNKEYFTPEPRVSFRYALQEDQALKLSYSRMAQYMHRISNSALSTPTDIWYPVTDNILPQQARQLAVAWQKFFQEKSLFASAEGYYKSMNNLIGFKEGTNLFFNNDFESKLVQGKGRAYGMEFLLRKEAGKFTGWLSYTLSWSWRKFDEMNQGEWFRARYDRRHNGALVMQYKLHPRWSASMVWDFISGSRFTPVIGQYIVPAPTLTGVDLVPIFSGINEVKMSDTHRLDLGLKFMSKAEKNFRWHFFAGVNNVYNRASPIGIIIEQDATDGSLKYSQPGLFGLLPFLNFGFQF